MYNFTDLAIRLTPGSLLAFVSRNQWRSPILRRLCSYGASRFKRRTKTIPHGIGRGLRFNTGNSHSSFAFGTHKFEVQRVLAAILRPGMSYYDVGANVGFFAVLAARLLNPQDSVICFEPVPENVSQINYNARLNNFSNVSVLGVALGRNERTESFYTSNEPTWGNLASVGRLPAENSGEITVTVRTLDSVRDANRLPPPALIKIDVEGAEAEVLQGAASTIRNCDPILVIELHGTNDPVSDLLEELGYVAMVLGDSAQVRNAHWNANIIAFPANRSDLVELAAKLPKSEPDR
jgi:FkbM family methyltransferase